MPVSTPTTIKYVYVHDCNSRGLKPVCPDEGQQVVDLPAIRQGVAWPVTPVCITTGAQLKLIETVTT